MRQPHTRGSLAAEVAIGTLIVAAMAIPLLTLLFQERDTEQRSRLEYWAILAARDEVYESRMAVAAGAKPDTLSHDWRPLKDNVLERIKGAAPGVTVDANYHPDQARIATKLTVDQGPGRLRTATLVARWVDPPTGGGTAPSGAKERPTTFQLVFGLLLPPWTP